MEKNGKATSKEAPKLVGMMATTAATTIVITLAMMFLSSTAGGFASDGAGGSRKWTWPILIHVVTVVPAMALGAFVLFRRKGTRSHRLLGGTYCALMLVTATATLFIRNPGHGIGGSGFSAIHVFTLMAFTTVPWAIWSIRRGDVEAHGHAMIGSYIGLCIAGGFALLPGRLLSVTLLG